MSDFLALAERPSNRLEDWRYVDLSPFDRELGSGEALSSPLPGTAIAGDMELDLAGTHNLLHQPEGDSQATVSARLAAGAQGHLRLIHAVGAEQRGRLTLNISVAEGASLTVEELTLGEGQLLTVRSIRAEAKAQLRWTAASTGSELERHVWSAELLGENCCVDLAGAGRLAASRQLHHLVRMYHRAGNAQSRQRFHQAVDGKARFSFDGLIYVNEGADGTDAEQQCRSLQLSDDARIGHRPQLEIFADDVSAAHGAAIGRHDDEQRRYLRSRGIDGAAADRLLERAFLDQVLQRFEDPELRPLIEAL
jgi:Fe-S cluster assembly protein SufD